ncbi:NAD-dependent epimerase/dehydratase family protein [Paenibacillus pinistramenti]|uniref:NAD-dependent epimerase/dehydratase family protein n=1 Tax=Paenibacillus pinistramenti TaxID=1768003 RepID=UPI0011090E70|nr:NAD-dependent epimerase/dehydratase family protein [Paenibacillus pinistramenti]
MSKGILLITGAGGFTGIHACRHFAGQGYTVIGAVRRMDTLIRVPNVDYFVCDMSDEQAVWSLVDSTAPDYVLHLAGNNSVPESWEHPFRYMKSNLFSALTLLEALRGRSAKLLIVNSRLGSLLSPHSSPNHPYGLSKSLSAAASLGWAGLFNQPVVLAEPGNLIGPGPSTGFCSLLARHIVALEQQQAPGEFRLSSGLERRDFLDVRDAVKAYELLLMNGEQGGVYPVCSGIERTLQETADEYQTMTAVPLKLGSGNGPTPAHSLTNFPSHSPSNFPKNSPAETPLLQPAELFRMGWTPAVPWRQSLLDTLGYYRGGGRLIIEQQPDT